MSRLFLLSGTLPRDPAVDQWFAARDMALGQLAREWFERMRACGEDVRETLHDGCPVACVGEAAFAYVNVFSQHVNVGFYQGSLLADPAGILLGEGKWMRHVKLRPGTVSSAESLAQMILTAYADIRARI
jgi:hypothetical protein